VPAVLGAALLGGLAVAGVLARAGAVRRVPSWGCGGELTPETEYTATAFSKPLMLVFHAVYRPTRDVETLTEGSRYFPTEVRYRAQIEPTFERYLYEPLARGVWHLASVMKGLQAGSLHAYLAYVLVLGVLYLLWLGGAL
jgi:hydrogenase-4 component B